MRLTFESVKKKYGSFEVLSIDGVSFTSGETIGIVGKNGAGKSTFLRVMTGLSSIDAGRVLLDGKSICESEDWRDDCGVFLDESFLIEFYTPNEYLDFAGCLRHLSRGEVVARKLEYADFFHGEVIGTHKLIRELSAGNRKKLGIAGALLSNPSMLILDEPFSDLDPQGRRWLLDKVKDHRRRNGLIVVTSHDLHVIEELADRIIMLDAGKIIRDADSACWHDLEMHFL